MNNKKNSIFTIVLAVLLALVAAGGVYAYSREKKSIENYKKQIEELKNKTATPAAIVTQTATKTATPAVDTSDWKSYTNDKYGYSFRYPADYTVGNCPKPCKGQVNTLEGGDNTFMSGDTSEKGWPSISITHYDTDFYNIPENQSLLDHLKEKAFGDTKDNMVDDYNIKLTKQDGSETDGIKISVPASPQAYSRWEIYYAVDQKMFQIVMLDVKTSDAQNFYNAWLKEFRI